jgi:hypothetical protein
MFKITIHIDFGCIRRYCRIVVEFIIIVINDY